MGQPVEEVTPGRYAEHLATTGVHESCELRSSFGLMAFHGGHLEKVTDIVAAKVASLTGSSYYQVLHDEDAPTHIPSKFVHPGDSQLLADFLGHVTTTVALHGYGRDHLRRVILLGGSNRDLAQHLAEQLNEDLPKYEARYEIDEIPRELRGLHPDNPVNLPVNGGVQIELPPTLRWNWDQKNWSDHGEAGRAPQVDQLIASLSAAVSSWTSSGRTA